MKFLPLLLCVGLCAANSSAMAQSFTDQENEQGNLICDDERPVLFFQRAAKSLDGNFQRADYVHPLYDLEGNVLTEDFPADHRHHRGVFWAWHQVWLGEKKIGDPWLADDFMWEVTKVSTQLEDDSATLVASVVWKSPQWIDEDGQPKPLVNETTTIRVHHATDNARKIDFEIRLQAVEENLRIGGSEDDKGYGGFSVRLRLPNDVQFSGHNGPVEPKNTAVEAGPWIDIGGTWSDSGTSGVTILCHPTTPGFPQPWILRNQRSMQNPVYPGRRPVELSTETPIALRYRLIIHRGQVDSAAIEKWHARYTAEVAQTGRK